MSIAIDLTGKRALVTGGSRGIGRAVVEALLAAGASVGFSYRRESEALTSYLRRAEEKGHDLEAFPCDFENPGAAQELFDAFCSAGGAADILVANAGIWEGAALEDLSSEHLWRTLKINVDGVVQISRCASGPMKERGWGRIIAIGSTAGQRGEANFSQYAMSKGAVHLFVKSIAVELAPFGVNVNTVAPGWVKTDMSSSALVDGGEEELARQIPRGLIASPEDIAGPVLFLCSQLANHLVGATLSVNGGSVLD